jgi:hypothetical protein
MTRRALFAAVLACSFAWARASKGAPWAPEA